MSRKGKLVVFTTNNARVLTNPTFREINTYKNAVVDPDLSKVIAVPPHFWKKGPGNLIIPMTDSEQKARLDDIKRNGVDNVVKRLPSRAFNPAVPFYLMRQAATVLFFVGSVLFCYAVVKNNPGLLASLWNNLN